MTKLIGHIIPLLFACLFIAYHSSAGDSTQTVKKPAFLNASLFYDFPQSFGATAGMNFPYKAIRKEINGKNSHTITRSKDRFVGFDVGFYRYEFNHTGIFLSPYIGTKRIYKNNTFFESTLGAGMLHTIYDGQVYEVDNNGNVKEKRPGGRLYGILSFSVAYGIDFTQRNHPKPFALQIRPLLWFQLPYNGFLLPHGSLSIACKYRFKQVSVKHKLVVKHRMS